MHLDKRQTTGYLAARVTAGKIVLASLPIQASAATNP